MIQQVEAVKPQKEKWHQNITFLVLALLIVGPFAIPLIWINRNIVLWVKVTLMMGMLLLTWALFASSDFLAETLDEQMAQMRYIRQQFLTPEAQ